MKSIRIRSGNSKSFRYAAAGFAVLLLAVAAMAVVFLLFRESPSRVVRPIQIPAAAWSRDIAGMGPAEAAKGAKADDTPGTDAAEQYLDGSPIGGLGAGSITWRYDGNFYDGRLSIGRNEMEIDESSGFSLYQKPSGQEAFVTRLDVASLGPGQAKYHSLFPKSWVDYSGDKFTCKAKVNQFSPLIPGDYKLSSYPVGIYEWELTNPTETSCDISLMFTWDNNFGGVAVVPDGKKGDRFQGITLRNTVNGEAPEKSACEFSIGCEKVKGAEISYASSVDATELYNDFSDDGILSNKTGEDPTGAVCIKATLEPGQVLRFPMVLAWDMPVAEGFKNNDWYREYTRYFGRSGTNSWAVAKEALTSVVHWEQKIDDWQDIVLKDTSYPDWLKTMLFNELYYYLAGGTVWEAGAASGQADNPEEDMFGSMECYEFPYYGTSDVWFYGSWALLQLWPDLEKQSTRQFCDSVYTTREDRPEALGTTAHDFGQYGSAFQKWNAYTFRDSRNWKDLNSKLVLMVYRDWALTGKTDKAFLDYCWLPVQKAMEKVKSQDENGDGLPDSSGIDQTYDNMSLKGDTAYCGGLFLAACEAAVELAKEKGNMELSEKYGNWLVEGQKTFESKLWNGEYYNIDAGSENTARIMSDQLCGQWYAVACGLPGIVSGEHAASAFTKIYENNFKKFDDGAHGIVNVMLPSGKIDRESSQSSECWVGTSWGVAAGMIQQGMDGQAEEIGKSLYDTIWNSGQMWFRTPEAWQTGLTEIRSPYYMRATAVWAAKHAYDLKKDR